MEFPNWPTQDQFIKELLQITSGGNAQADNGLINISTKNIDLTVGLMDDLTWHSIKAQFDIERRYPNQKEWSPTIISEYRSFVYKYKKIEGLKTGRYTTGQINGMCDASDNTHLSFQYISLRSNPDEFFFTSVVKKTLDFLILTKRL